MKTLSLLESIQEHHDVYKKISDAEELSGHPTLGCDP